MGCLRLDRARKGILSLRGVTKWIRHVRGVGGFGVFPANLLERVDSLDDAGRPGPLVVTAALAHDLDAFRAAAFRQAIDSPD